MEVKEFNMYYVWKNIPSTYTCLKMYLYMKITCIIFFGNNTQQNNMLSTQQTSKGPFQISQDQLV